MYLFLCEEDSLIYLALLTRIILILGNVLICLFLSKYIIGVMIFEKIQNISDSDFSKIWLLYQKSFPVEEKRTLLNQKSVMGNEMYTVESIFYNNDFIGFIMWWQFPEFLYLEHFSVSETKRNKGFGELIMRKFQNLHLQAIVLEVDMPVSDMAKRRISFYKRLGFYVNDIEYKQALYNDNIKDVELLLMSYPSYIDDDSYRFFVNEGHSIICQQSQ